MGPQTYKLRRGAGKQIPGSTDASQEIESMSADGLRHLVHEMRVHEIELRIQNDTLRQTQYELEKLQERFMELYDNAPVGYISIDTGGAINTANRTAADLLGLTRKELVGRSFTRCVATGDKTRFLEFIKPLSPGRPHGWEEVRLLKAGGEIFYTRLEGHALNRGGPESSEILLCLSDISEKKQAEDELAKTRDRLRKLAVHLQSVREEERKSIAREIHDEMGQVMAYLKMSLPVIEARIPETDTETRRRIQTMKGSLADSIQSTKSIISRLRPYQLDELGLIPALESYVQEFQQQFGIKTHLFASDMQPGLSPEKATAIYRIVKEGLSNVARHSGASYVVVSITEGSKKITLEIRDDGVGFAKIAYDSDTSYGIIGMRERAVSVDGDLEIYSRTNSGTRLTAWVPK